MKPVYRHIAVVFFFLSALFSVNAQNYYEWSGAIGDRTFSNGGTHIVLLKGDVSITGTITVCNATTLRIRNQEGRTLTIRNGVDGTRNTPMFRVYGMGKLAFNYDDREFPQYTNGEIFSRIILDGGAGFGDMDRSSDPDGVWRLSASSSKKMKVSAIESIGALEIYNTTIRNFYFPQDSGGEQGVIGLAVLNMRNYLSGSGEVNEYRYTTIRNTIVEKCKGVLGTFIIIGHGNGFLKRNIDPNGKDSYGSYRYITLDGVTVQNCVTFTDSDCWGGLIRGRGASLHSMIIRNSVFQHNFSHGDGAVLWWNACGHSNTKCTIEGCQFIENRAMREAGAIRIEGSIEFKGTKTIISGNDCLGLTKNNNTNPYTYSYNSDFTGNGGGIQIFGYAGGGTVGAGSLTYVMPDCLEVTNNKAAGYGGGIAFDFTTQSSLPTGTEVNANFNGVKISDNMAGKGGGGIFFSDRTDSSKSYKFHLNLNTGNINGNSAPNGGGIYVQNINVSSQSGENIYISNNKATAGCGGGIYLQDGTISLNSANISNNEAIKANDNGIYGGGGIFVKRGSFTLNSGSIYSNISDLYGGGVFVYNDNSRKETITLTNGVIRHNKSKYGGGLTAYGALILNINNINIENNEAWNGGGFFVKGLTNNSESIIQYNSGIIRYNRAKSYENSPMNTAYDKTYTEYSGIGGGIYLGQFTNLKFSRPENFGIYSNIADNGADEIFGYNKNVYIELPNISSLNLNGYNDAKIHNLFWAEDYITNDTKYDKGTKLKGAAWDKDKTNQRYRDVRENGIEGETFLIDFNGADFKYYTIQSNESVYLSLTIGWNLSTITLVKKGMKDGDNAIFKLYRVKNGREDEYMTVVLSDKDKQNDGSRLKNITLIDDGVWKVVETDWSWAYEPNTKSIQRELTINSTPEERTFEFVNTQKSNIKQSGESIKINKIK